MIDFRTDVMTLPTGEMWEAMRRAEIGWTLYRQDRAVNELEERVAALLGKQAGLFVPTCGMANLLGLMTLGERGTQAVLESNSHIIASEEWGITSIAGLYPRLVSGTRGVMYPVELQEAIMGAPRTPTHQSKTSLVCLENTHNFAGGTVLTASETDSLAQVAHQYGASVYLDGARLWNAAAALKTPAHELLENVDAVGVSLNKGLCAPFGALFCGAYETIAAARLNARRIGAASVHKAGIFAAAALVAFDTMLDRLDLDNQRARRLAKRLADYIEIDMTTVQTNIVFADVAQHNISSQEFAARLETLGVLVYARPGSRVRFVTHRMIGDDEVERAVHAVRKVCEE
ncbi:MAG: aminotransferase class I/II-fold pyridoxal phosphate-dependent enzyme [Anaerolineae bacterium]|nr:aminotransferase class I/II-fold pyridoxal phosphate-dependent enzyme [Anaerolineae bacterium]